MLNYFSRSRSLHGSLHGVFNLFRFRLLLLFIILSSFHSTVLLFTSPLLSCSCLGSICSFRSFLYSNFLLLPRQLLFICLLLTLTLYLQFNKSLLFFNFPQSSLDLLLFFFFNFFQPGCLFISLNFFKSLTSFLSNFGQFISVLLLLSLFLI